MRNETVVKMGLTTWPVETYARLGPASPAADPPRGARGAAVGRTGKLVEFLCPDAIERLLTKPCAMINTSF